MAERFAGPAASGTPIREKTQSAREIPPVRGEAVLHARRAFLVRPRDQDSLSLEATKTIGQDVRGNPRDAVLELAESTRTVEQRLDDEQAPAVADAIEGGFESR
jgi:hypothetical protein